MTGAVLTLLGGATAAGSGGGGVVETWANIYGGTIGANKPVTFSGLTGTLSISATITGTGQLGVGKNHLYTFGYTGAFNVSNGDTLYWYVVSPGGACSGTITITDATHSTTMATFTYTLTG